MENLIAAIHSPKGRKGDKLIRILNIPLTRTSPRHYMEQRKHGPKVKVERRPPKVREAPRCEASG